MKSISKKQTMKPIKTTDYGLMKFKTIDLYSSTSVAKELGTTHQKVLKAIIRAKGYIKSHSTHEFSEILHFNPLFIDAIYINERGREYKSINMNLDGAKVLVKMIDTQKAYNLYAMLMSEFNMMQMERDSREQLKHNHLSFTDKIKPLADMLEAEGSQQHSRIYTTIQLQVNRAVTGKPTPRGMKPSLYREQLSQGDLDNIHRLEDTVFLIIDHWIDAGLDGRSIRRSVKDFLHGDMPQMFMEVSNEHIH